MKKFLTRYSPVIIGVLLVLLLIGFGVRFVLSLESAGEQKKVIQQITVIKPPEPEPEPPPPEEPEEEIEEELEEEIPDDPEPLPDQSADEPSGEELGVDADATAGGDSFGLKARKGGRGLLAGGGYGAYVKAEINKVIVRDEQLKYMDYMAVVSFMLAADGRFTQVQVDMENGNEKAEKRLKDLFFEMGGLARNVPIEEQSRVFKLRISSIL
jgi:protein TonB